MVFIILTLGMIAAGSSVVFVKLGDVDPFVLAAYRLLLSALVLLPWFYKDMKPGRSPSGSDRSRRPCFPVFSWPSTS